MAKLPALVAALARNDERERATLDHYARVIRQAGLIPTTKRGSGASEMTVREAANLLIAVNGSETPKDAPSAVVQYRSLIGRNYSEKIELPSVFSRIDSARNLGEALEALIFDAPKIRLAFVDFVDSAYINNTEEARRKFSNMMLYHNDFCRLDVTFSRPAPYASIRVVTPGMENPIQHEWQFMADGALLVKGFYPDRKRDRTTAVTVHLQTVLGLALAIHGAEGTGTPADPGDVPGA